MKLTSVRCQDTWGFYSECVTVHVWMKNEGTQVNPGCTVHVFTPHLNLPHCSLPDLSKSPSIEILSPNREIIRPTLMKGKKKRKVVFAHPRKHTVYSRSAMENNGIMCLSLFFLSQCPFQGKLHETCVRCTIGTTQLLPPSNTSLTPVRWNISVSLT